MQQEVLRAGNPEVCEALADAALASYSVEDAVAEADESVELGTPGGNGVVRIGAAEGDGIVAHGQIDGKKIPRSNPLTS